jgi:drug/metabolite transporter (DMT)-like permease
MTGILFGFLTSLSWAIGIFPFAEAGKYYGANSINTFRLMLATLFLAAYLMLVNGYSWHYLFYFPATEAWLWLGLSGFVGLSLGDYFSFSAFSTMGARNSSIFATLAPGAAFWLGWLLLGEEVNLIGIAGMFVTILGILLLQQFRAAATVGSKYTFTVKGITNAVLAAACQGAGLVFAKKGFAFHPDKDLDPIHATWIRMIIATAVLYLFILIKNKFIGLHREIIKGPTRGLSMIMAGTLFGPVLGVSLSLKTVSLLDAGIAQTIFSVVPVLAIPIAWFFYKEKITWPVVMAALVALGGVMILIWRQQIALLFS